MKLKLAIAVLALSSTSLMASVQNIHCAVDGYFVTHKKNFPGNVIDRHKLALTLCNGMTAISGHGLWSCENAMPANDSTLDSKDGRYGVRIEARENDDASVTLYPSVYTLGLVVGEAQVFSPVLSSAQRRYDKTFPTTLTINENQTYQVDLDKIRIQCVWF